MQQEYSTVLIVTRVAVIMFPLLLQSIISNQMRLRRMSGNNSLQLVQSMQPDNDREMNKRRHDMMLLTR